ncbi:MULTISPECIES: hypothetical protein [unclassified Variovorax]|uniref:hypothetical protein n=1 Tax=unclassified Variovorax TaxID=663243 RepID=UPI002574BD16|nr:MULTISPECIES: hypothetical protein [unclassified Variovorax]MDM0090323.1 hypothetical protein [Variovorax sp. J22G40]MDM0148011.1 hypothetical protein [Variovorax sp. J2P1-31]
MVTHPQKVWLYKTHRIVTWTEPDGAGFCRWSFTVDDGQTVKALAGGYYSDMEALTCAFEEACRAIDSKARSA